MRCRGLIALLIWGQSVAAADLGTWGDLWPVKEPDMLTVIMQRLTALEQSGEMAGKWMPLRSGDPQQSAAPCRARYRTHGEIQ